MSAVDLHYEDPRLAEVYDYDSGWSIDRDFYLELAGPHPQRILDLGCGTGLICDACAAIGHHVVGVDPSPAMLDIARRKPNGDRIRWIQTTAQDLQLDEHFDVIMMTGHAFQVLLHDADVSAALTTMRTHLAPSGCIAFESRNPNIAWESRWNYDQAIALPNASLVESRRFLAWNGDRMTFELSYAFPDGCWTSRSELRFLARRQIEERLLASGLQATVYGDWSRTPFDAQSSQEMIFIAHLAR